MKGMQKIRRGKSFSGVVLYALKPASHHKVNPVVIGGNMMGYTAGELIDEFNITKLLRPDVKKSVWHNSLRLPKGESLSCKEWTTLADVYMERMGFSDTHLRCYVLHDDEEGQHIHIIGSRIDLNGGKLYLGKNENLISTRVIQQLERDYHLTKTNSPDNHNPSASPAKRKKSRNESMLEDRTGEKCPKEIIQEAIDKLITSPIQIQYFVDALATKGITAKANVASTGRMNGFSFEYNNISFKASQLGKKYSWKHLELFIINVAPSMDNKKAPIVFNAPVPDDAIQITATEMLDKKETDASNFFVGIDMEDIQLPSPEAVSLVVDDKARSKSYVDVAMRWIETIPYLDSIVSIVKKLRNPLIKCSRHPAKIFSATFLPLDNPSMSFVEKTPKKNVFRLKN